MNTQSDQGLNFLCATFLMILFVVCYVKGVTSPKSTGVFVTAVGVAVVVTIVFGLLLLLLLLLLSVLLMLPLGFCVVMCKGIMGASQFGVQK